MNIRRKIGVIALGLVLVLIPLPAHADDGFAPASISDCQANEVCTFDGFNFGNPHYDYNSSTRGCHNIGAAWNDRISSIVNNSPRQIWGFENAGCWQGGGAVLDGIDAHWTWTGQPRQFWANRISSIDFG